MGELHFDKNQLREQTKKVLTQSLSLLRWYSTTGDSEDVLRFILRELDYFRAAINVKLRELEERNVPPSAARVFKVKNK